MNLEIPNAVQVLERGPQALRALLAGLPAEWTDADEGPGTWSPRQVVAHLIHAEEQTWVPRVRVFLDQSLSRALPTFDQAAPVERFAGAPLEQLLDEFIRLRGESLAALSTWRLGDAELAATAIHPAFGEVTLRQLLAAWVAHDLAHLAQVSRVMAKQYRHAVGPWHAFLSIMNR
ncbi:MAG TPA: DinB family protein [Longimicrobium sp.]|jgi:hypothetical protein|uniref:DinB family protein n=1 Tax=Longimicrobium sp. TaxID=2029185 RepID=UPI002EDA3236